MGRSKLQDLDSESLLDPAPSSSSDGELSSIVSDEESNARREHYVDVSHSRLRRQESILLGPQYTGNRIKRSAAEDDDSDDPFARKYNVDSEEEPGEHEEVSEEEDSDEEKEFGAPAESAVQEIEQNGTTDFTIETDEAEISDSEEKINGMNGDKNLEIDGMGSKEADEPSDDEASYVRALMSNKKSSESGDSHKLREMLKDTNSLANTIAASAQSDVTKGNAIKQQRKTFDSLLNTRVRLQKALISTNSMTMDTHKEQVAQKETIEAAEKAALTLLKNLNDLKKSMDKGRSGQKRKRAEFESSTSSTTIWGSICASESDSGNYRRAVLEKWSAKTRAVTITPAKGQLNTNLQQSLTEVLSAQLADSERLIMRTQIPRSCAPLQANQTQFETVHDIYDDADFYGVLLKELLEQRSAHLTSNGAAEFVVQAPWQIAREAKTKKIVDTKASKGRRLRYTVHEKLQNFMAPENRGIWGERQRDDLFSSLFGQRPGLGERNESDSEQENDTANIQEQSLMLFRN